MVKEAYLALFDVMPPAGGLDGSMLRPQRDLGGISKEKKGSSASFFFQLLLLLHGLILFILFPLCVGL